MRFRSEVISAERVEVLAHQRRCQTENVVIAALALSTQLINERETQSFGLFGSSSGSPNFLSWETGSKAITPGSVACSPTIGELSQSHQFVLIDLEGAEKSERKDTRAFAAKKLNKEAQRARGSANWEKTRVASESISNPPIASFRLEG